jgi:hypothetical protein
VTIKASYLRGRQVEAGRRANAHRQKEDHAGRGIFVGRELEIKRTRGATRANPSSRWSIAVSTAIIGRRSTSSPISIHPKMDDSDSTGRRRCQQPTLEASRAFFVQQAQDVSADGTAEVTAYILDCSTGLRRSNGGASRNVIVVRTITV